MKDSKTAISECPLGETEGDSPLLAEAKRLRDLWELHGEQYARDVGQPAAMPPVVAALFRACREDADDSDQ